MEALRSLTTLPWQEWVSQGVQWFINVVSGLVVLVIGLVLAGWFSRWIGQVLKRRETDPEVALLLTRLTRWGTITLFTVMGLQQAGFEVSAFLAGLGVIGFTIGFAIQDVSKNLVAGVLLLLQQPFDIGDAIEVAGYAGSVLDITLRATELKTWDGRRVYIPNADVYTSPIVNYSRTNMRRVEVAVGVAYDSDLEAVRRVALEAVREVPGVCEEPAPEVAFHTFGASSVDCTVYFWIDTTQTDPRAAKDAAVVAIHRRFAQAGIEIPYPVRTVYLQGQAAEG